MLYAMLCFLFLLLIQPELKPYLVLFKINMHSDFSVFIIYSISDVKW
jgi:hypothetical protein